MTRRDCVVCKLEFRTRNEMLKHESERFDVDKGVYRCCLCEVELENGRVLSEHLDSHSGVDRKRGR